MSDGDCITVVICSALIVGIVTSVVSVGVTTISIRAEAVKAGAAEWVADEDGSAKFQWRTCE